MGIRIRSSTVRHARIPRFGFLLLILVSAIVFLPRIRSIRDAIHPPAPVASIESAEQLAAPEDAVSNPELSAANRATVVEPVEGSQTAVPDSPTPSELQGPLEIDVRTKDLLSIVTDNTLQIPKREMPAYWQLLQKSMSVPFSELRQQSKSGYKFNDFYSRPSKNRGALANLDIVVRRITRYDAEPNNPAGVPNVYEIWGSTEQAHAWLYVFVTDALPEGFDEKTMIGRKATFAGYFLKVLAYQPGSALPNAKPLAAPLLIGRFDAPQARVVAKNYNEAYWGFVALGGVIALFIIGRIVLMGMQRRRPKTERNEDHRPGHWEWMEPSSASESPSTSHSGVT